VPKYVPTDLVLLTPENVDTEMYNGVAAAWPRMPRNEWDLWPVMDTSWMGIETPTKAMRLEYQGY
jgi:hypothetical protein